jgi:hypothetical protein
MSSGFGKYDVHQDCPGGLCDGDPRGSWAKVYDNMVTPDVIAARYRAARIKVGSVDRDIKELKDE